ncbi:MAG: GH92 family glycosyl hydrolase [Firmicutes bacterium]|nr:GH92 family glycosyl hydrolase [Bacillota bacterium]
MSRWKRWLTALCLLPGLMVSAQARKAPVKTFDPLEWVNPFIGTGGHGHTYPGASAPFGAVQLSPDTRLDPADWDGCGGYHHSDSRIYGFSHTHLSGTGVSDYCDVLFAPHAGELRMQNGGDGKPGYGSAFDHGSETARPGYYAVTLKDHDIRVELTATARVGLHRYTFPKGKEARLIVDLVHRDQVLQSGFKFVSDREIEGFRHSRSWAKNQRLFFVVRFSRPFVSHGIVVGNTVMEKVRDVRAEKLKAALSFGSKGGPLLVAVGLSAVSVEGARKNLDAEMPRLDFEQTRRRTERAWSQELSKIEIEGGTADQRTIFYTALYHTMLSPNVFQDVDGMYLGRDLEVHGAEPNTHYTVFSLWDTFRALHPLLSIIDRPRSSAFARTFLRQYEQGGRLPVWELAANETECMIGYHAVPVLADLILKGIGGFDHAKAFEAMKASAEKDHFGLESYKALGYVSGDREGESVSKTLEYAFDDWCIAQVARKLGRKEDEARYLKRAQAFKHLFDPGTGFFRGRMEGHWWSPFDPSEVNANYTEANAWQYAFFVPHDMDALLRFHAGKEGLARKLDGLFAANSRVTGTQQADITGLIGQYAHGNEPSHHIAYLYAFAGQPWKTQALVRRLLQEMYRNDPDGLIGNEDCGQMSAWYVLSALGFYSVTPASNHYVIGSPLFPKATLHLGRGRTFTLRAEGEGPYIQSATLNGQPYLQAWLDHDTIQQGGELNFVMGREPNKAWGAGPGREPRTAITESLILPVPFVAEGTPQLSGPTRVALDMAEPGAEIRYTLDGSEPGPHSLKYAEPFTLETSTVVKAVALKEGFAPSGTLTAPFTRIPKGRSLQLQGRYSRQYSGGGDSALIDGLRGGPHWRLGRWQGYQGQDLTAVVDLGSVQTIHRIAMGFIADSRSWILFPAQVEFEISKDGVIWLLVGTAAGPPTPESGVKAQDCMPIFPPSQARYVRVRVTNPGPLPKGHPGEGNPSFFFTDEIVIE